MEMPVLRPDKDFVPDRVPIARGEEGPIGLMFALHRAVEVLPVDSRYDFNLLNGGQTEATDETVAITPME